MKAFFIDLLKFSYAFIMLVIGMFICLAIFIIPNDSNQFYWLGADCVAAVLYITIMKHTSHWMELS